MRALSITINKQEREIRLNAIRRLMKDRDFKAMLFVADSYLGKKGSLRYLFDNHLIHRYGYGLVFPNGQHQILPSGLYWCTDRRVPDALFPGDHEILEVIRQFKSSGVKDGKVGVVGLNNTMKLEDYYSLKQELPGIEWQDASIDFDIIRSIKSEQELEGVREANRIIEAGFDEIIKHIRVGMTEEEAVSVAYSKVHAMGAKDTLFLTLSSEQPGAVEPIFLNPRPRKIKDKDYLIVSLEITGPTGHWVEHSRMFCFGERDRESERLAKAVADGILIAEQKMKPGVNASDIQEELDKLASELGYQCGHLSGHGIGMDVIERPFVARKSNTTFVGVEVPGAGDSEILTLKEGMVISFHPQLMLKDLSKSAYMSDVFIIKADGAQRLSKRSHEVIFV